MGGFDILSYMIGFNMGLKQNRQDFLISDYATFQSGWGNWINSNYQKYETRTYAKGATANTMDITFQAGDIFTLPNYKLYKFHLIDYYSEGTDIVYVVKDGIQNHVLTAEEANHVKSIIVAHISSDPLTAEEIEWINANAKIIRQ